MTEDTKSVRCVLITSPMAMVWMAEAMDAAVRSAKKEAWIEKQAKRATGEMLYRRKAEVFADAARILRDAARGQT